MMGTHLPSGADGTASSVEVRPTASEAMLVSTYDNTLSMQWGDNLLNADNTYPCAFCGSDGEATTVIPPRVNGHTGHECESDLQAHPHTGLVMLAEGVGMLPNFLNGNLQPMAQQWHEAHTDANVLLLNLAASDEDNGSSKWFLHDSAQGTGAVATTPANLAR